MPSFKQFSETAKQYGQGGSNNEWFRPPLGESRIRILSEEFEVLAKHWDSLMRKSHVCYGQDEGCPYDTTVKDKATGTVKTVHKPGIKYLVYLIDRADGKVKIGELPYSVIKVLEDLASSEEYGYDGAPSFDVIITKTKTGPQATDVEYSLIPSRKDSPITEAEQKEFSEKISLVELIDKMKIKAKDKTASGGVPDVIEE